MHINPDHFLTIDGVRAMDADRNAAAWQQCFATLPRALEQSQPGGRLYVLIGTQGAGKSTWAAALKAREPRSVVSDATLVKKAERAPIIPEARPAGVETVTVWFQPSLESCLARNAGRPPWIPRSSRTRGFRARERPR